MTAVAPSRTPEARRVVRRVEQVMGMPISLALDGRYAATPRGEQAWADVIASLRDADAVFSTYRPDSAVSRLAMIGTPAAAAPPAG